MRLTARESPMILRAIPLAMLLFWLAYESHFSFGFFGRTVGTSVSMIVGGIDDAMSGKWSMRPQKVASSDTE